MVTTRKPQTIGRDFSAWIESWPDVLAGEPVLKGTRIAVRHVAELVRLGASLGEIVEDLDITPEQIDVAVAFDRHALLARVSAP